MVMNVDVMPITTSAYGTSASQFNLGGFVGAEAAMPAQNAAQNLRASRLDRAIERAMQLPNQLQQETKTMRRFVKVIIVDPDENVPLANCVLYAGSEKMTDLTDQELYFELDIKGILAEHNAKRITFIDKKVKERTEPLEPAKIRDLRMVVIEIAKF